jgi:hypothetical protein
MKVAHKEELRRAPWWLRLLSFWFPIFLLGYLVFVELVWRTVPVSGPIAWVGRFVPVPIGHVEGVSVIWYGSVLSASHGFGANDIHLDKQDALVWSALRDAIVDFSHETNSEQKGKRDIVTLHAMMLDSVRVASERGDYQDFAKKNVEDMRALIDLGIYFPDLALQYSQLPSRAEKGTRVLMWDELPESYRTAIDKEEIALVETASHYVFVKITKLEGEEKQYKVVELGIIKQGLHETVYAYLTHHPVKWF